MSRKSPRVPRKLRQWLESLDEHCEYCRSSERVSGIALEVDHIVPRSRGGALKSMFRETCSVLRDDSI